MRVRVKGKNGERIVASSMEELLELAAQISYPIHATKRRTPYIFVPFESIGCLIDKEVYSVDIETLVGVIRTTDKYYPEGANQC